MKKDEKEVIEETKVVAVVKYVFPKGEHGPYIKAYDVTAKYKGSFTVSYEIPGVEMDELPAWEEDKPPKSGDIILIWKIHRKIAGWRADKARYYRLSDELISEEVFKQLSRKRNNSTIKS